MENKVTGGSEVSLVEMIFSVFIFAVAGAIMLNCFASARYTQIRAYDKTLADMKIQSEAEYIRATDSLQELGNMLAERYGFDLSEGAGEAHLYYDSQWQNCDQQAGMYVLTLTVGDGEADAGVLKNIGIRIDRVRDYPFGKGGSKAIFEISTKKFYPDF